MKKILDRFGHTIYEYPEDMALKDAVEKAVEEGVSFRGANLEGAKLDGIKLDNGDFSKANLSKASFTNTRLTNLEFRYASLGWATFSGALLENVDTYGSCLAGADVRDTVLRDMDFFGSTVCILRSDQQFNTEWRSAIAKMLHINPSNIIVLRNAKSWDGSPIHDRTVYIHNNPSFWRIPAGRIGSDKAPEVAK